LLALVLFIGTRDEVTRSFTIPLRVIPDPDRVLLTEPPATVEVRLRGPWAHVNRIAEDSLGSATLDLREVRPGPMALDPASVVMPAKVVLDQLEYDPVDLRFEAVIERGFAIRPSVVGSVDPEYELVAVRVEPERWPVRGPSSAITEIAGLKTEVVDLEGARADVELRVELAALPETLEYLRVASGERPEVRFVAELTPILDELELVIATDTVLREALPEQARVDEAELPASERVSIRGPKAVLRELAALDAPVVAIVEIEARTGRAGALPVTLRFDWSAEVPKAASEQLSIVPPLIRLRLAVDPDRSP
jgi:YbbR domain-containing protein